MVQQSLIVEVKALEDILRRLCTVYADGKKIFNNAFIKQIVIRLLYIQKALKEDYNITYNSSLLFDFSILEEVKLNGDNVENPSRAEV